jgi:hypothetical protein
VRSIRHLSCGQATPQNYEAYKQPLSYLSTHSQLSCRRIASSFDAAISTWEDAARGLRCTAGVALGVLGFLLASRAILARVTPAFCVFSLDGLVGPSSVGGSKLLPTQPRVVYWLTLLAVVLAIVSSTKMSSGYRILLDLQRLHCRRPVGACHYSQAFPLHRL